MNTRILFLPADPEAAATLLDVDDSGRALARATLRPGTAAPAMPAATRAVLVVPGEAVRIDRLDLPAHSAAQAQAAARALLSERLARKGALHVALDAGVAGTLRTVAAVEPRLLRGWLDRAAAFGLVADAAVPEQLLLPMPEDEAPVHVLDAGDRWLVRGTGVAFVATPALAVQVLGERPRVPVDGGLERFAARALRPEVDLLQGEFTAASQRARPASRRRLALLAAALLVSPLLLVAAQALRLELAARALESRAAALAREALPADRDGAPGRPPRRAPPGRPRATDLRRRQRRPVRRRRRASGRLPGRARVPARRPPARGRLPRRCRRHRGPPRHARQRRLAAGRGQQQRNPRWPAHRTGPGARSMKPIARFLAWWHGRAPRERMMLAVMAALLAAFAWWYGLLWPLRSLREDAGAHYDRASVALQEVEAGIAALAGTGTGSAPAGGEALRRRVLDSARDAGLAPSRQRNAADGAFVLEFERVASPALFGWLGELAEGGLAPSSLRVARADGRLRAEVGFGGATP